MAKYLTAQQYYLASDDVPNADSIPTWTLNRMIVRAENMIDAYVGFDTRLGGFEEHAAWYQDAFDEKTLRIRIPNYPVPVRNVQRYRIQVSNTTGGNGFFADISNDDCAISVYGGYVEIVPLQAITYSMTPFMMGLGLKPPLIQIDYKAGFFFPVFGETLDNPDGDLQTYRALRGFWAQTYDLATIIQPVTAPPVPPVVYLNGVIQTTGYTVDYTEGTVTFSTALASTDVVKCDYTYTIPDPVRDATITQVTWLLNQRALNQMGMGGVEVVRNRDQQIKRHIRASQGADSKDEPTLDPQAMQLLEPYTYIPMG